MGEAEKQPALISRGQHARGAGFHHNGVTHSDICRSLPDTALRPDHRHEPHRAVERGQIEAGPHDAILNRERAGEERNRRSSGRLSLQARLCARIAARPYGAKRAAQPVYQAAVDIADPDAQPLLPEVVPLRIGGVNPVRFRMPRSTAAMVA